MYFMLHTCLNEEPFSRKPIEFNVNTYAYHNNGNTETNWISIDCFAAVSVKN